MAEDDLEHDSHARCAGLQPTTAERDALVSADALRDPLVSVDALSDPLILRALPMLVCVLDRAQRIVSQNRAEPELSIGSSMRGAIAPDDRPRFDAAFACVCDTHAQVSLELLTSTGRAVQLQLIPLASGGEVSRVLSVSSDVTERARREAEAREAAARAESVLAASGVGSWSWTASDDRLVWDPIACAIFGVAAADGQRSSAAYMASVPEEDRPRVREAFSHCLDSGSFTQLEHRIVQPSGELRHVCASGVLVRDAAGRVLGFRGGVIDVTARKLQEHRLRQEQKMQAIGQLAAGIAHNFNNLLSVIVPNVTIARGASGRELGACLDDIEQGALGATQMIEQLMLFTRKRARGRQSRLDLGELVRRTVATLRAAFSDIQIDLTIAPDVPPVAANAVQLEHVLLNVCVNARDACAEANRRGHIRIEVERTAEQRARVRIRDDGPGMSEQIRARVFEPFFTTKELGRGPGLGLSSAYAIMTEHRGQIRCESTPGAGTTVEIELPAHALELPALLETLLPPSSPPGAQRRGGHETILLVAADPEVRRPAAAMLAFGGYRVLEASAAQHGLERVLHGRESIDLALVERALPEISGEQLSLRMRALRPALPIILVGERGAHDPPSLQAERSLAKPLDAHSLFRTVRELLDQFGARERGL